LGSTQFVARSRGSSGFLNALEPRPLDRGELVEVATEALGTRRRQELAIEAMQRDPGLAGNLPDLSTTPREPVRDPLEADGWLSRADDIDLRLDERLDFGP
jgi:hypothetical protein